MFSWHVAKCKNLVDFKRFVTDSGKSSEGIGNVLGTQLIPYHSEKRPVK